MTLKRYFTVVDRAARARTKNACTTNFETRARSFSRNRFSVCWAAAKSQNACFGDTRAAERGKKNDRPTATVVIGYDGREGKQNDAAAAAHTSSSYKYSASGFQFRVIVIVIICRIREPYGAKSKCLGSGLFVVT